MKQWHYVRVLKAKLKVAGRMPSGLLFLDPSAHFEFNCWLWFCFQMSLKCLKLIIISDKSKYIWLDMSCAVKMQRENQITVSHITQNKQIFNTFKNRSEMFSHFCGKKNWFKKFVLKTLQMFSELHDIINKYDITKR